MDSNGTVGIFSDLYNPSGCTTEYVSMVTSSILNGGVLLKFFSPPASSVGKPIAQIAYINDNMICTLDEVFVTGGSGGEDTSMSFELRNAFSNEHPSMGGQLIAFEVMKPTSSSNALLFLQPQRVTVVASSTDDESPPKDEQQKKKEYTQLYSSALPVEDTSKVGVCGSVFRHPDSELAATMACAAIIYNDGSLRIYKVPLTTQPASATTATTTSVVECIFTMSCPLTYQQYSSPCLLDGCNGYIIRENKLITSFLFSLRSIDGSIHNEVLRNTRRQYRKQLLALMLKKLKQQQQQQPQPTTNQDTSPIAAVVIVDYKVTESPLSEGEDKFITSYFDLVANEKQFSKLPKTSKNKGPPIAESAAPPSGCLAMCFGGGSDSTSGPGQAGAGIVSSNNYVLLRGLMGLPTDHMKEQMLIALGKGEPVEPPNGGVSSTATHQNGGAIQPSRQSRQRKTISITSPSSPEAAQIYTY